MASEFPKTQYGKTYETFLKEVATEDDLMGLQFEVETVPNYEGDPLAGDREVYMFGNEPLSPGCGCCRNERIRSNDIVLWWVWYRGDQSGGNAA